MDTSDTGLEQYYKWSKNGGVKPWINTLFIAFDASNRFLHSAKDGNERVWQSIITEGVLKDAVNKDKDGDISMSMEYEENDLYEGFKKGEPFDEEDEEDDYEPEEEEITEEDEELEEEVYNSLKRKEENLYVLMTEKSGTAKRYEDKNKDNDPFEELLNSLLKGFLSEKQLELYKEAGKKICESPQDKYTSILLLVQEGIKYVPNLIYLSEEDSKISEGFPVSMNIWGLKYDCIGYMKVKDRKQRMAVYFRDYDKIVFSSLANSFAIKTEKKQVGSYIKSKKENWLCTYIDYKNATYGIGGVHLSSDLTKGKWDDEEYRGLENHLGKIMEKELLNILIGDFNVDVKAMENASAEKPIGSLGQVYYDNTDLFTSTSYYSSGSREKNYMGVWLPEGMGKRNSIWTYCTFNNADVSYSISRFIDKSYFTDHNGIGFCAYTNF